MQELRLSDLPQGPPVGVRHKRPHRAARAGPFLRISRHNAKAAKVSLDGLCRCVAFAKGLLRRALLERSPSLLSHRTHSLHCEAVNASPVCRGERSLILSIWHLRRCQTSQRCCPNYVIKKRTDGQNQKISR